MSTLSIIMPYYNPPFNLYSNRGLSGDAITLQERIIRIDEDFSKSYLLGEKKLQITQALSDILLECSHSNWDGYGAKPIDKASYYESLRFAQFLPNSFPNPEVTIEPDGEIAFEWFSNKQRVFSVSIGRNGELTYAGLFGFNKTHGTEFLADEVPRTILENIKRVFE